MAHGFKSGGHAAGVPNRKTALVERLLDEMKCNPVGIIAAIAMNPKTPAKLRFLCAKELAQYIAPRLKAIEVRAEDSETGIRLIQVNWGRSDGPSVNEHADDDGGLSPR